MGGKCKKNAKVIITMSWSSSHVAAAWILRVDESPLLLSALESFIVKRACLWTRAPAGGHRPRTKHRTCWSWCSETSKQDRCEVLRGSLSHKRSQTNCSMPRLGLRCSKFYSTASVSHILKKNKKHYTCLLCFFHEPPLPPPLPLHCWEIVLCCLPPQVRSAALNFNSIPWCPMN